MRSMPLSTSSPASNVGGSQQGAIAQHDQPLLCYCHMRRILRALHTVGHRYRASEEMRAWRARDPVSRFQRWLLGQGWWSEGQDAELRQSCRKEVSAPQ